MDLPRRAVQGDVLFTTATDRCFSGARRPWRSSSVLAARSTELSCRCRQPGKRLDEIGIRITHVPEGVQSDDCTRDGSSDPLPMSRRNEDIRGPIPNLSRHGDGRRVETPGLDKGNVFVVGMRRGLPLRPADYGACRDTSKRRARRRSGASPLRRLERFGWCSRRPSPG